MATKVIVPKREVVGIPNGTQHVRDKDGLEARDWKNSDGTTVYRVTNPSQQVPNPQEAAERRAAK